MQLAEQQRVTALVPLPDGSVLAANLGRVLAGGLLVPTSLGAGITAARFFPGGDLLAGGWIFDGGPAYTAGRLRSTCPATAAAAGAGCSGSGGANVLAATTLPWLGATFTARATGMPANGIAVAVLGLATTAVPLAPLLPQAGVQCALLVAPDVLDALVPANGAVATQLVIPNVQALAGVTFHEQVVALELGAAGVVGASSTNRLTMTAGTF